MNMLAGKKRKIDDEGRVFSSEWCTKFIVGPHNQGVFCLVCQITIAVMKEYNIKCHYATKHSSQFDRNVNLEWVDKIEHLKKSFEKQVVFTSYKKDSQLMIKLSFKLCECMAKKGKPFSDREFQNYLTIFTEYACSEKKHLAEQTNFSRFTVLCRINDLSDDIKEISKEIEIVWSFQSGFEWEQWHSWTCHFHQSFYCWLWLCWRVFRYGKPFLYNRKTRYVNRCLS